jgi:hypothetical protein
LAGAGLAEEAGEVGLGFVGADFLHAGSGLHVTSLLKRPVGVKRCGGRGRPPSRGANGGRASSRAAKAFSGG